MKWFHFALFSASRGQNELGSQKLPPVVKWKMRQTENTPGKKFPYQQELIQRFGQIRTSVPRKIDEWLEGIYSMKFDDSNLMLINTV